MDRDRLSAMHLPPAGVHLPANVPSGGPEAPCFITRDDTVLEPSSSLYRLHHLARTTAAGPVHRADAAAGSLAIQRAGTGGG
jgi:hypothetical protein